MNSRLVFPLAPDPVQYHTGMLMERDERLKIPVATLRPQNQFIELLTAFERWLAESPYGVAYELMRVWREFDYMTTFDYLPKKDTILK